MSGNLFKQPVIVHMPKNKGCLCSKCVKFRTEFGKPSSLLQCNLSCSSDGNEDSADAVVPASNNIEYGVVGSGLGEFFIFFNLFCQLCDAFVLQS